MMLLLFCLQKLLKEDFGGNATQILNRLLNDADGWPQRGRQFKVVKAEKSDGLGNGDLQLLQSLKGVDGRAVFHREDGVRRLRSGEVALDGMFRRLVIL